MPPVLFTDRVFLEHQTGASHPESPRRLETILSRLEKSTVWRTYARGEIRPASAEQLQRVHDGTYVQRVDEFCRQGGGRIEADTVCGAKSYEVALRAAGAAIAAVDAVLTTSDDPQRPRQACCLIRPPGHHALQRSAMGFCLFNNVAVAAEHALQAHGLNRVLIVDWDVHHGNGTQDLFYATDRVTFFSAHRFPFYPGTGARHETGTGRGMGYTFNLPLKFGIARQEYRESFQTVLTDAAKRCRPELVLLSAGFDAHQADPVGSLGLESEDFEPLTKLLRQVADQYCQGKLVSLLEGGYNVEKLAESVEIHLRELAR